MLSRLSKDEIVVLSLIVGMRFLHSELPVDLTQYLIFTRKKLEGILNGLVKKRLLHITEYEEGEKAYAVSYKLEQNIALKFFGYKN